MLPMLMTSVLLAAAPSPPPQGLDHVEAAHFARRTGLSARPDEVAPWVGLSRAQAVDRLLAGMTTTARTPLPPAASSLLAFPAPDPRDEAAVIADVVDATGTDPDTLKPVGKALVARFGQRSLALKAWWMEELVTTSSPFTERITLVFHDHFTSSLRKVRDPRLMAQQNALYRAHAGGSYAHLLHAVVDDGAMLRYLDANGSTKEAPNENLARELLELFTLGEGNYAEADVKAAARALTGRRVRKLDGEVVERRRLRDRGDKTFLGVTGDLRPHDLVDRLLKHPRTAEVITEKLWVDLISEAPNPARIKVLADVLRRSDYQMKPLLRALLLEDAFWANAGSLVRSPVELVVVAARERPAHTTTTMGADDVAMKDDANDLWRPERLVQAARSMGQDLFDPPNVKGWPVGTAWVTTATIAPRDRFLRTARAANNLAALLNDDDGDDDDDDGDDGDGKSTSNGPDLLAATFQTR